MPVTIGGGLRTLDHINAMLRAGADKVSLNTPAVERPAFVREAAGRFGSQCIVVAIDARRRGEGSAGGWEVYTHGGRNPAGLDAVEWARRVEALGAGEILLTSMDCDGTKGGYDLELTAAIADGGGDSGDRVGRGGDAGAYPGGVYGGEGGRGAGGVDFSFWDVHDRGDEGVSGGAGDCGAAVGGAGAGG